VGFKDKRKGMWGNSLCEDDGVKPLGSPTSYLYTLIHIVMCLIMVMKSG
jgi:hypothetical protein